MGKHNAPVKHPLGPTLAKAGTLALVTTGPIVLSGGVAEATPVAPAVVSTSILEAIAICESGNQNIPTRGKSTASGYYQILDSTWRAFGGREFAARALHASKSEQLIVAQRILGGQGLAAWAPSKNCWSRKAVASTPTPKPQAKLATKPVVKPVVKTTPKPAVRTVKKSAPISLKVTATKVAKTYLIHRGDTLSRIARTHGTTVRRLAVLNSDTVRDVNRIYYGKHLRLA